MVRMNWYSGYGFARARRSNGLAGIIDAWRSLCTVAADVSRWLPAIRDRSQSHAVTPTVRPIFVIGSPRSATTMLGNYIGSARSILNAGEYRAIYLAYGALPNQLAEKLDGLVPPEWEPWRRRYMAEVQQHAKEFILRATVESGLSGFCDSSPRNALISDVLADMFPDALFILTLRHFAGVVQSILRLGMIRLLPGSEPAMDWIEPTASAAAQVWTRHYQAAMMLPPDRTIVFGYDAFCQNPDPVLAELKVGLASAGFPVHELDDGVLAVSHAQPAGQTRRTVMTIRESGRVIRGIPSFDPTTWTEATELAARNVAGQTDEVLRRLFPGQYVEPVGYLAPSQAPSTRATSHEPTERVVAVESADAPRAPGRHAPADPPAPSAPNAPNRARATRRSGRGPQATGR
jgi:hypothetical protein